ncbi:MAG: methyltransferase domain-containing protein [Elusimicrobia bacterium]|nr:methyltransferase domain-containing protein [Elusimicrobiota bacterium]
MTKEIKNSTIFYKPNLTTWKGLRQSQSQSQFSEEKVHFFLDGDSPNWIAVDERGSQILQWVNGQRNFGDILRLYSQTQMFDFAKSWLHCHTFLKEALQRGIISLQPFESSPYLGRSHYLKTKRLKEFWIHLTQTCNLTCSHCLVSSGPKGKNGPNKEFYLRVLDETSELGVERYYFTGGEPFIRSDIFDLIQYITETKQKELIILTNATLFTNSRIEQLKKLSRKKVKFQVSIDGTTPQTNDSIRGIGVFEKAAQGLRVLSELGFETSLTAVVTKKNLQELGNLPKLAKELGAKSIHLMWLHKRGRILEAKESSFPTTAELLHLAKSVKRSSENLGIIFDNVESLKLRVNGHNHVKYDLGMMGWESLCLYLNGELYPSAAMAGQSNLSFGTLNGKTIQELWLQSDVAQRIRNTSVINKISLIKDPFQFLTGGGDIEHSYFFSANGKEGNFLAPDPYYELYVELIKEIMLDLAIQKKQNLNSKSGFNPPTILHSMGEDAITCSEDAKGWLSSGEFPKVRLLHSNCVLSFDVEKPYKAVQKFYGKAAEKPQEELCCPIKYDDSEISHIPQEVIDRFYGCGSPISMAQVKIGETTLDLGSGAGIDCFIAAKKVGAAGKVIGVDMTDQMLEVANRCKETVAKNLGFDVVEFKKGYLEKIPVPDHSVDLVTSNCVINLSPDKKKVFAEIWRILKDTGRLVVADIVSDRSVPLSLQAHQELWGECISGSLSEDEFLAQLQRAGFYGISLLKKTFWKEVEGVKFYSITVRGFKFEKKDGCKFIGQKAIYLGPYQSVMDEEGHLFPRGEKVEICTDTAAKLQAEPYMNQFHVLEPGNQTKIKIEIKENNSNCCGPSCC